MATTRHAHSGSIHAEEISERLDFSQHSKDRAAHAIAFGLADEPARQAWFGSTNCDGLTTSPAQRSRGWIFPQYRSKYASEAAPHGSA